MRRRCRFFGLTAATVALTAILAAATAQASHPVNLEHGGIVLLGDYVSSATAPEQVYLLVHGTMAHKDMEIIETLQTLLADNGRSSLAITLGLGIDRRQGFFDCETRHDHIEEQALDEIGAWLDWLGKTVNPAEVILVGHSRGANQVARFARGRASGLVKKIVLIAPSVSDPSATASVTRALELVAQGSGGETLRVPRFLHCQDSEVSARSYVSYYGDHPDRNTIRVLASLDNQSVLVVAGSADELVPNVPAALTELDPSRRPQLVVLEGADHFFRDLYADELLEAVIDFVDQ